MPYKNYNVRRRRTKRKTKSPWYARKYSAMEIATKALRQAKYIKKYMLNTEQKLLDTEHDS